mmetsp:Transcript_36164/g.55535  ORF Transcript_36164/g.55535 Transcript_36164/m.55535 type:complete len:94 (+) Transcript_36164:495-776(+)
MGGAGTRNGRKYFGKSRNSEFSGSRGISGEPMSFHEFADQQKQMGEKALIKELTADLQPTEIHRIQHDFSSLPNPIKAETIEKLDGEKTYGSK